MDVRCGTRQRKGRKPQWAFAGLVDQFQRDVVLLDPVACVRVNFRFQVLSQFALELLEIIRYQRRGFIAAKGYSGSSIARPR